MSALNNVNNYPYFFILRSPCREDFRMFAESVDEILECSKRADVGTLAIYSLDGNNGTLIHTFCKDSCFSDWKESNLATVA